MAPCRSLAQGLTNKCRVSPGVVRNANHPPGVVILGINRKAPIVKKMLSVTAVLFQTLCHTAIAADINRGEALVKRWCAECHLVAAGQKATTEAPPFSGIAKRPDFDAAKVAFFLLDPHPKMPNMQLNRSEAADIAAYIATLQ